jgi:hypothetical protein
VFGFTSDAFTRGQLVNGRNGQTPMHDLSLRRKRWKPQPDGQEQKNRDGAADRLHQTTVVEQCGFSKPSASLLGS